MKILTLVEAFTSLKENKSHWIEDTHMHLYLSQCSVFINSNTERAQLPFLSPHFPYPKLLESTDQRVVQINMWMNFSPCSSSLHYDANHNLLSLIEGRKTVTLLSPSYTYLLKPYPSYYSSPNHSRLSKEALNIILEEFSCEPNTEKGRVSVISDGIFIVEMKAGDVLFIPEGWWHAVDSERCSYAVNYWFESPLKAFLAEGNASHMSSYLVRLGLHSLLSQQQQSNSVMPNKGSRKRKLSEHSVAQLEINGDFESNEMQFMKFMEAFGKNASENNKKICQSHNKFCLDLANCSFETMATIWPSFAAKVTS